MESAFQRTRGLIAMVTAHYLLEGAVYALEQCGLLLGDAASLYEKESFANTIVLAVFAREELGRYRTLRTLRKRVLEKGENFTVADIRRECRKHEDKLSEGQLSIVQRPSPGDEVDTL